MRHERHAHDRQFGVQHLQDLSSHVTAVRDRGPVRSGGVDAERYDATLSPDYVATVSQQIATSMASSAGMPAADSVQQTSDQGAHIVVQRPTASGR